MSATALSVFVADAKFLREGGKAPIHIQQPIVPAAAGPQSWEGGRVCIFQLGKQVEGASAGVGEAEDVLVQVLVAGFECALGNIGSARERDRSPKKNWDGLRPLLVPHSRPSKIRPQFAALARPPPALFLRILAPRQKPNLPTPARIWH